MDDKNEQLQQEAERLALKVKATEEEGAEAPAKSSGGSKILRGLAKGIFCLALSLLMIHVIKPMYYQYIDASAAQEMTDGQKQEAMGLPLKMTKPPKGKKSTWSREELRWMVFMDIKLDELKACVNERNETGAQEYNKMARDYNERCGEYYYKESDLKAVRLEVEKYRDQIKQKTREEVQAKGWDKPAKK